MNANVLIPLAEKLDKCSTRAELEAVKKEYGKETIDLAWAEYLGDRLKQKIVNICKT